MERTDYPGFWQSVTGGLEAGETPAEAALRELKEETGLQLQPVDHHKSTVFEIAGVWRPRYDPKVTHNREHWFSCETESNTVHLDAEEHTQHVWLSPEAAIERASSPTNQAAIRELLLT